MSRLVRLSQPSYQLTDEHGSNDDYMTKVAKLIPSEVVACYLSILGIVKSVGANDAQLMWYASWAVFGVCWLLTPVYLQKASKPGDAVRFNVILSTIAFPIWAYALGGPFDLINVYKPWLASIILGLFTLSVGALPVPAKPS